MSDERISLQGPLTKAYYPNDLRLIRYYDEERQKILTFLTNNFKLAATTIAQIYTTADAGSGMRQSSLSLKNCFRLSKQTRPPLAKSDHM